MLRKLYDIGVESSIRLSTTEQPKQWKALDISIPRFASARKPAEGRDCVGLLQEMWFEIFGHLVALKGTLCSSQLAKTDNLF